MNICAIPKWRREGTMEAKLLDLLEQALYNLEKFDPTLAEHFRKRAEQIQERNQNNEQSSE